MDNRGKNWPIIGNAHIADYLARCLKQGKIEQTYVFEGPKDLGKYTALWYFIQCLYCAGNRSDRSRACGKCPNCLALAGSGRQGREAGLNDLYVVKKSQDKKQLGISQVRELIRRLNLSSFMNGYKIGVVKDADHLSPGAANALLKTLEEPKKDVVIFLLAQSARNLPSTIVSRAQVLRFRTVSQALIYDHLVKAGNAKRSDARYLSHLAMGRPALALKFFEDKEYLRCYEAQADKVFAVLGGDINARITAAAELLGQNARGQEAELKAGEALDIYEGASRDLALGAAGAWQNLRHIDRREEIAAIIRRLGAKRARMAPALAGLARKFLKSNVKPQTVLEYLAISI